MELHLHWTQKTFVSQIYSLNITASCVSSIHTVIQRQLRVYKEPCIGYETTKPFHTQDWNIHRLYIPGKSQIHFPRNYKECLYLHSLKVSPLNSYELQRENSNFMKTLETKHQRLSQIKDKGWGQQDGSMGKQLPGKPRSLISIFRTYRKAEREPSPQVVLCTCTTGHRSTHASYTQQKMTGDPGYLALSGRALAQHGFNP